MSYDRQMIEAAIRNGADVTAGEAAALLGTIDRLEADLRHAREDTRQLEHRAERARRYLEEDLDGAAGNALGALNGVIR